MRNKDIPIQLAWCKPYNAFRCPSCGREGKFSLYVYTATNEPVDPEHRCGRCSVCRYNYPPREYFAEHGRNTPKFDAYSSNSRRWIEPFDTINEKKVIAYHHHKGPLYDFLVSTFPKESVDKAWDRYLMGAMRNGKAIFWQVDNFGAVRTGQKVKYLPDGHRDKETEISWVHNSFRNYNLMQCIFGLHLVGNGQSPVFVVEAPKTALICSICYPQHTWLAVISRDQFNGEMLWWIRSHRILALPDVDALAQWQEKAKVLNSKDYHIEVLDFLELYEATKDEIKEIGEKGDIGDLLIMRSKGK